MRQMLVRFVFHWAILLLLAAAGGWLIRLDLTPPSEGGLRVLDGLGAAMYWFGLLIFALLGSLAYTLLRKHSFVSLISAYLMSAGIAAVATAAIVMIGQRHAEAELAAKAAAESLEASAVQARPSTPPPPPPAKTITTGEEEPPIPQTPASASPQEGTGE